MELLLQEMVSSINDFDIIRSKIRQDPWIRMFQSISAEEYGSIILHVNVETDQPRVAALMASTLNGGNGLTCSYAASAVQNSADWTRCAMVERLAPLCIDVAFESSVLRAELNEWEVLVTQRFVMDAIAAARREQS